MVINRKSHLVLHELLLSNSKKMENVSMSDSAIYSSSRSLEFSCERVMKQFMSVLSLFSIRQQIVYLVAK